MLSRDSDVAPLAPPVEHERDVRRSLRKWFESLVVVGGLVAGGMGIGYWGGIQQEREARLAEIDRLRKAYELRLTSLSGRVSEAADTAANAAAQAGQAASAAETAAQTATQAAKTAKEAKKP